MGAGVVSRTSGQGLVAGRGIGAAVDRATRDYGKELAKHRARVRFEAAWTADVAKAGRRYFVAVCAPSEDDSGEDQPSLLFLAHDRRECMRARLERSGIVEMHGRFQLSRAI